MKNPADSHQEGITGAGFEPAFPGSVLRAPRCPTSLRRPHELSAFLAGRSPSRAFYHWTNLLRRHRIRTDISSLAGVGIEPTISEYESDVLPLHYPAMLFPSILHPLGKVNSYYLWKKHFRLYSVAVSPLGDRCILSRFFIKNQILIVIFIK